MVIAWNWHNGASVLFALAASIVMLPAASHCKSPDSLIGATVISEDEQLVGAIDAISQPDPNGPATLIVALAGYLAQGEKDVAVAEEGITMSVAKAPRVGFANPEYGGASLLRIHLPLTVQQIVSRPTYKGPDGAGKPSRSSTSPAVTPKKPGSSTESGGPG